jgi:hypothetical protein
MSVTVSLDGDNNIYALPAEELTQP